MADGHVNKCKECNKKDVIENRKSKVDYYREYDKDRGNRQTADDVRRYREENPKKYKAHLIVNNAVRGGYITRKPCEICGEADNTHAHHDDYDKPRIVRWLCPVHHKAWHLEHGEALNAH